MKFSIRTVALVAALVVCSWAIPAQAGILLAGDSNIFGTGNAGNKQFFQNVFNGKSVANYSDVSFAGESTTATVTNYGSGTAVTSGGLSGMDYLVFGYNQTSVSASELTAITTFYSSGGSVFLFGEGNTLFVNVNNTVNSILTALGSTMSLSTTSNFDNGGFDNLTGMVTNGPFAVGVTSWRTAYASKINVGSGQAVISGVADNGFGVAVAFEGRTAVPEPASLAMWGLGALSACIYRRRKRAQE
ncbi:MAG: PEP-CTERM sorting domain-containing protein [Planctomyces sp.]|nr:PEP-CTERM sorting domain-containing protein [Planctomyces sp.]